MVRWFRLALALSVLGSPALAQKKKQEVITAGPAEDPPPKSKPKAKPKPEPEDEPESEPAPKAPSVEPPPAPPNKWISVFASAALSTSNASQSLTPLPFLGASFAYENRLSPKVSFRIEPALALLRRRSQVTVVRKVDASAYPDVKISTENITNQVTAIDLSGRLLLSFDYSDSFRGRAGLLLGLGTAATGAGACSGANRITSLLYGLHLVPVALKLGKKSDMELGLLVELRSQKIPRCDVPLKDDFQVNAGEIADFKPKVVEQQLTVVATGLQFGLAF